MTELIKSIKKCRVEGNTLYLPSKDEDVIPNYAELRTALLNAGAKYKRNAFIFNSDAQPLIDRLCSGQSVNIRKEFQFFPTPEDIADWLVELALLKDKDQTILEPSAGQGAIIDAIARKFPKLSVDCFELMPENRAILEQRSDCFILGSDFTKHDAVSHYDRIVANPPFSKNQDIDHVLKMYECLTEGGRIVTIASKHWQLSNNKKEKQFREWLKKIEAEIYDIEKGRFRESGTMISCCVIVINKISAQIKTL